MASPKKNQRKSDGARMSEKTRAACNKLSDEKRESLLHRAMHLIYQDGRSTPARVDRR
jgi:hypothetical protein